MSTKMKTKHKVGETSKVFDSYFALAASYPELKPYKLNMYHDNAMVFRRCDRVENTVITCVKTSDKCIRVTRVGYVTTDPQQTFVNYGTVRNAWELVQRMRTYAESTKYFGTREPKTVSEIIAERRASKPE